MQTNAELKAELDAMRSKLATAPSATTTPPPRRNSAPSPKTPTPVSGPSKHERSQKPAPKKLAVSECSEDDFEEGEEEEDDDDVDTDQDESEMDDEGKVDEGKKGVVKKTGQKKESKTKGGKKEDGTKVERKKKDAKKTDDEELTEAAKNNRLRRVCEVKPSGRCGVDDETHARWAKGGAERLALRDQLESCDWDKDGTSRLNIHGTMTY